MYNLKKLGGRKPKPAMERFEEYYIPEPNSGCWIWLGCPSGSFGYGKITITGVGMQAHRYAWSLHNGPIPNGMLALHKCDTPACVNPGHLFLGTAYDNSADRVAKGRQARGQKHSLALRNINRKGRAKLTHIIVNDIRRSSAPSKELAAQYGVSMGTIWRAKSGRSWND